MKAISVSLISLLSLASWSCSSEPKVVESDLQEETSMEAETGGARTGPLNFAAPEGWTERETTGAMRFKEYVLGDDEAQEVLVVVAYWGNGVGGLQGNLNRWKGQVAGGEGSAEPTIETYSENGLISTLLDGQGAFTGMEGGTQTGSRLMAAYIESPSGRFDGVYTIKLNAASEAIAPWAESFRQFIQDL